MKKPISIFFIIILLFYLQFIFEKNKNILTHKDLLYFPKGSNIKFFVCGYNNLFSDLLWIRGGIYYGDEKIKHGKFEYLFHIYDVITSLDDKFLDAYIYGAFFINYQLENLEEAIKLINKGINQYPDEWVLHFYKGFLYYISFDFENAYKSFIVGSKLEKGSTRCKKFALVSLIKEKGIKEIFYYWIQIYNSSRNIYIKEIAFDGIKEALKFIVERYKIEKKIVPNNIYELLKEGYIPFIPIIDGKEFKIENGEVIW